MPFNRLRGSVLLLGWLGLSWKLDAWKLMDLVKCFFCVCRDDCVVSSFVLWMWCITSPVFSYVEPTLQSCINSTWSGVEPFLYNDGLGSLFVVGDFCTCIPKGSWRSFVIFLTGFGIRVVLVSQNESGCVPCRLLVFFGRLREWLLLIR